MAALISQREFEGDSRGLLNLALPILYTSIIQSASALISTFWVGHFLGSAALAATNNANVLLVLLAGLASGVMTASGITTAQAIGGRKGDKAKRTIGTSIAVFTGVGMIIALLTVALADSLLRWVGTPAQALPYALAYLRVAVLSVPAVYLYNAIALSLRAAGDSVIAFRAGAVAVAVDAALSPILIFGLGPIPGLGIAGAAAGMLIGQILGVACLLAYLIHGNGAWTIKLADVTFLRPDLPTVALLVKGGMPLTAQTAVVYLQGVWVVSLVNDFGVGPAAAYGALLQVLNYIQMPSLALSAAATAVVAQKIGAGRTDCVDEIVWSAVLWGACLTSIVIGIVGLEDTVVLGLFLPKGSPSLAIARDAYVLVGWSFILGAVYTILLGAATAGRMTWLPFLILGAVQGVRLPLTKELQGLWGLDVIWWSFPAASIATVLLSICYYLYGSWRRGLGYWEANAECNSWPTRR